MADEDLLLGLAEKQAQESAAAQSLSAPADAVEIVPSHPDDSLISDLARQQASQSDATLRLALQGTQGTSPDKAAKDYMMAKEAGLPMEVVERQSDLVERNLEDQRILANLSQTPKTRGFLAEGDNFKLAKDDTAYLSGLEFIFAAVPPALKEGVDQVNSSSLYFRSLLGGLNAEEQEKLRGFQEAEKRQAADIKNFGAEGWFENAVVELSRQIPILWNGIKAGGIGAGLGAATGAGVAAVAGQLGPQAATPEEVLTVPAAAQFGARVGGGVNAARAIFELEAGQAYGEFSQFTDENGQPIDQDVAKVGALVYGGAATYFELFSLKKVLETVPGGKKMLGQLTKEGVKDAMRNPAVRAAILTFVKDYGKAVTAETMTEVLQEGSQVLIGEMVKGLSPGDFEGVSSEQAAARLSDTFVATMQSMSLLGAVGPGLSFTRDSIKAMKARNTETLIDTLAKHAQESKLAQRTPDKYAEFVKAVKQDTGLTDIYVDAQKFQAYFQAQGIDPEEIAKGLQVEDDLKAAAEAGNALRIPIEEYLTKIANTAHHEALKRDLTFAPGDFTIDQAEEFEKTRAVELQKVIEDSQREIAELQNEEALPKQLQNIREKLVTEKDKGGAGFRAEDADAQVRLLLAGAKVLSKESGETVDQWFSRVNPVLKVGDTPVVGAGNTFNQEAAATFYSSLQRVVEEKMPNSASVEQVRGILKNAPGIKAEEVEALDVESFFAGKEKVSKAQLLEYVQANAVQVQEVAKGQGEIILTPNEDQPEILQVYRADDPDGQYSGMVGEIITKVGARELFEVNIPGLVRRRFTTLEEAKDFVHENTDLAQQTKFHSYQLPGGKKYTELLLTLPVPEVKVDRTNAKDYEVLTLESNEFTGQRDVEVRYKGERMYLNTGTRKTDQQLIDAAILDRQGVDVNEARAAKTFKSGHFDEPNILVHVRFNERTDAEGKRVLFIEEVQSDWHQKGRKEGYSKPTSPPDDSAYKQAQVDYEKAQEKAANVLKNMGRDKKSVSDAAQFAEYFFDKMMKEYGATAEQRAVFEDLRVKWRAFETESDKLQTDRDAFRLSNANVVPDAPFKKTWHELAMKRMLRYAAENGYDKIAWTTGEQQAERYDLSKHVQHVAWEKNENSTYNISAPLVTGEPGIRRNDLSIKEIEELVGKDIATRIQDGEGRKLTEGPFRDYTVLEGENLKVGGEGMKGFYDQILPSFMNKYTKKWGGRVQTTEIAGAKDLPVTSHGDEGRAARLQAHLEGRNPDLVKVHSLEITPSMKSSVLEGQPLFQNTGTPKGSIEFANSATIINLFKAADRSTFLHEAGHLFMREMGNVVASGKASEQLKADYATLTAFVGGNISTVEAQEKLARAFEAYLREGKAPSVKLTDAFRRFRDWLTKIYKQVRQLDVELNDEVRGVFDRILASEAELAEAQRFYRSKDSLIELVNPTEDQLADLAKKRKAAQGTALDKQVAKRLSAYFDAIGGQAQLRKQAEAEVNALPVYKLIQTATEAGGLDLDAMRRTYGKEAVEALRKRFPGLLKRGGKALSGYVADYGFGSPDDAFEALTRAIKPQEAIKNRTADLVAEKESEIRRDLTRQETMGGEEAVHNDASLTYLLAEANILLSKLDKARQRRPDQLEAKLYKDTAKEFLQKKKVKEATRYDVYAKAEQRFAKAAFAAAEKGDLTEAYNNKVKQVLNHALVQEAIRLRDEKADIENYFKLKSFKSKLKNVENGFMEAAVDLATSFGFVPADAITIKSKDPLGKLADLDEVLAAQTPDFILRKEKPQGFKTYRDLPYSQFRDLYETTKAILNFGSDTLKSALAGEEQSRQAVIDASVARMQTLKDRVNSKLNELRDDSSRASKIVGVVDGFVSDATMVQFLSDWMDGFQFMQKGTFGPLRSLYNKVLDAEKEYEAVRRGVLKRTDAAWRTLGKAIERIHKENGNKITVPGVPIPEDLKRTKRGYWSGARMVALLLNTGNAGNMSAIQKGYAFTPAQIQQIAAYFTADELNAIQTIWTETDSLFPQLDQTHYAIYNRHIEKVPGEKIVFTAKGGKQVALDGGYYPLIFDHMLNYRAAQFFEEDMMKNQTQAVIRSTKPEDGATYSRVPGHSLPPLLDTSVWFRHVNNVSRYITHARILRDMNVITRDTEWSKEVKKRAGHEHYKALRSWLQFQANPGRTENQGILDWSRGVMTAAALGFKNSVGLKQRADVLKGIRAIGGKDLTKGWKYVAKAYAQVSWRASILGTEHNKSWQDIISRSSYVRLRENNIDREIADLRSRLEPYKMKRVTIAGKEFTARDVQDAAYFWIKMNDRAAVSVVWTAAYNKFIAENADPAQSPAQQDKAAIAYADAIIQDTQASSLKPELSAIQRGEFKGLSRDAVKLFTAFMTESLKYGNRSMQVYRAWSNGSITTKELLHHVILEQAITPWTALMLGVAGKFGDLPEWWEFLLEPLYTYLSWIPLVRDVGGYWQHGIDKIGDTTLSGALKPIAEGLGSVGLFAIGEREFTDTLWDVGELLQAVYRVPALNFVKDVQRAVESIQGA